MTCLANTPKPFFLKINISFCFLTLKREKVNKKKMFWEIKYPLHFCGFFYHQNISLF